MRLSTLPTLTLLLLLGTVGACSSLPPSDTRDRPADNSKYVPRIGGDLYTVNQTPLDELSHLQLVSTNLVSALVQIPELQPEAVTLQVQRPVSAFGNTLVRALEDAGFGLQLVSADQGRHYVSYSRRSGETDTGPVTDFELAVGAIEITREFVIKEQGIYPSSLMRIGGTEYVADVALSDTLFQEQGGPGDAFISGTDAPGDTALDSPIQEVAVRDFDKRPVEKRTAPSSVFAEARRRFFEADAERSVPELSRYKKFRKTVVIFADNETHFLGEANKAALELLVREYRAEDLYVIKACNDADGENKAALERAIRVEEELTGHGVPAASAWIAPCVRASYRHPSDNSPTPVEVIHYQRTVSG